MKTRAYMAMFAILASGLLIGFFSGQCWADRRVHRMMKEGPKRLEEMILMRLSESLRLTDTQIPSVQKEVRRMATDFERTFETHRREMDDRSEKLLKDIRPLVNPDQQNILDHMTADDLRPGPFPRPPQPPDGHRFGSPPPPPDRHDRHAPPRPDFPDSDRPGPPGGAL